MAPRNRRPYRHAFTLVELLVVIGIIVILIGILLPVANNVRKSAWATNSLGTISKLAAAAEQYRQDFNAYPGVRPNTDFDTGNGVMTSLPNSDGRFTMTENFVVAVLGGLDSVSGSSSFKAADVGLGPMSQSTLAAARKRYPPYVQAAVGTELQSERISGAQRWSDAGLSVDTGHAYTSGDSIRVPEFVDRFPDPMPILYVRARSGAPSFKGVSGTSANPRMDPDTPVNAPTQYNVNWLLPYANRRAGGTNPTFPESSEDRNNDGQLAGGEDSNANNRLDFDFSHDQGVTASPGIYFRNPGVPTEVRQKDSFWIIGAGPDRKYGTKDDQTNFGPL